MEEENERKNHSFTKRTANEHHVQAIYYLNCNIKFVRDNTLVIKLVWPDTTKIINLSMVISHMD